MSLQRLVARRRRFGVKVVTSQQQAWRLLLGENAEIARNVKTCEIVKLSKMEIEC